MHPARQSWSAGALLLAALVGCQDAPTSAAPRTPPAGGARADAVKFWEVGASVGWNEIASDVIAARAVDPVPANRPNPTAQIRILAYLSLAQYTAVIAAEDAKVRGTHPSPQAAVAGASAAVLDRLLPLDAARFEEAVRAQEAGPHWPGERHTSFAAGEAVGRAVGAQILERASTDRFGAPFTGTIPVGPQYWRSSLVPPAPPVLPTLGQMRTFFMTSGDQFRPPPPPAFGSPAYLAALAEVKQLALARTPEQVALAQFWGQPAVGTIFQGFARELIVRYHLDERRAAHALALADMAAMDAFIACHDGKYTYWLVRPSQADPSIPLAIPVPNHPSYPSNHACTSGTYARVLAALFPAEAERLLGLGEEAAESRVYAGIHYRFDKDAGLRIADQVAALALASDVHGHAQFTLR